MDIVAQQSRQVKRHAIAAAVLCAAMVVFRWTWSSTDSEPNEYSGPTAYVVILQGGTLAVMHPFDRELETYGHINVWRSDVAWRPQRPVFTWFVPYSIGRVRYYKVDRQFDLKALTLAGVAISGDSPSELGALERALSEAFWADRGDFVEITLRGGPPLQVVHDLHVAGVWANAGWIVLLGALLIESLLLLRARRQRQVAIERISQGLCPQCGYDLGAPSADRCPECGTARTMESRATPSS